MKKILFILILIFCLLVIMFFYQKRQPLVLGEVEDLCSCERQFSEPQTVEVSGRITATLGSGQDLAMVSSEATSPYQQYYIFAGNLATDKAGEITVKGKLTGITCSYAQTIFDGQCAAEIEAEQISQN